MQGTPGGSHESRPHPKTADSLNAFLSEIAENLPQKAGAASGAKNKENLKNLKIFLPGGATYAEPRRWPRSPGGGVWQGNVIVLTTIRKQKQNT